LICGKSLKDILLPSWVTANESKVNLQFSTCTGYLEVGNEIRRVYLESPGPLTELIANNWRTAQKISDLVESAALMSQTPAIFAYFSDAGCVLTLVVRASNDEKRPSQDDSGREPSSRQVISGPERIRQ
jgi:hypothetical protein